MQVPASSPTISNHPSVSTPVAVAVIPVNTPEEKATLFHCLIFKNPDVGIAAPVAVEATFKAEYTPISNPDAPPLEITVFQAGTFPDAVLNGINLTLVEFISQVPPSVADSVIAPNEALVD